MTLSISSEEVRPEGTFNIQVFLDLLGRPMIDRMSVFLRETAQNAWDARLAPDADVDFSVEIGTFTPARSKKIKSDVFPVSAYAAKLTENIHGFCDAGKPYIIVRDANTIGLAGPTEANAPGRRRNFTSFIRNVGQDEAASNASGRGGTFGFGKTVFFRVSKARTFIAYSRTEDADGRPVSRLMGVSLSRVNDTLHQYTGRHWWGVVPAGREQQQGFNQPLSGKPADDLAEAIGFTRYDEKSSGTSIMVIGPEFGLTDEQDLWDSAEGRARIAQLMQETLTFWYWPRSMGGGEKKGRLNAYILAEGKAHPISATDAKYPIPVFADCFTALQSKLNGDKEIDPNLYVKIFEIKGRSQRLGLLAIAKRAYRKRETHAIDLVENHPLRAMIQAGDDEKNGAATNPSCHHVALIREPGQVVRYLPTIECTQNGMEYAAVFLLAPNGKDKEEIREHIKRSEPPSHDDWSKEERWAQLIVSEISRCVASFAAPPNASQGSISDRAGKISLLLGSLWDSGEGRGGNGGGGGGGDGGGGGGDGKSSACKWDQELTLHAGKAHILYTIHLSPKIKKGTLRCSLKAALYGGGSDEIPGGTKKRFAGWFARNEDGKPGKLLGKNLTLEITEALAGKVILALAGADIDAAIAATFNIDRNG